MAIMTSDRGGVTHGRAAAVELCAADRLGGRLLHALETAYRSYKVWLNSALAAFSQSISIHPGLGHIFLVTGTPGGGPVVYTPPQLGPLSVCVCVVFAETRPPGTGTDVWRRDG